MAKKIKIINYKINSIKINSVLKKILYWSKKNKSHYICVSNVHSCIESYFDKKFKKAHNSASLAVADGRPIFWALKLLGQKEVDHLPGYYLTEKICELSSKKNLKVGFYGSKNKILNDLRKNIKNKYKKISISYKYSPPFRNLNNLEKKKIINGINKSKVKILFICLGCPKQELWMYENRNKLKCTMIGIGAAADFLSHNKILPNKFFEYLGLAWTIRLITEPRRLFWRYFSTNFLFIFLFTLQLLNLKNFK